MPLSGSPRPCLTARSGGRILADALVAQGITKVFAVPGESFLDTLDGLYDVRHKLQLITCRVESAAVHMAEACGKLSGWPAAAMVTRGPGACHGAIGVHVAQQDSTPLLVFVGQVPAEETDRDSFQEIDYRRMFSPLAKWVTQIDDPARIPEIVAHAVDVSISGRPGPVVIAIPEDMQRQPAEVVDIGRSTIVPPSPEPSALGRMQTILKGAKRPLVILGGSRWTNAGLDAIASFLLRNDLPVAVSFRRQSLYDGTASNYVGDFGVGADPELIAAAKDADLILVLGARLNEATTQRYTLFEKTGGVPIVHVYPDAAEIGRVFRPTLGIVCDLNAFAHAVATLPPVDVSWSGWTKKLRTLRLNAYSVPSYPSSLNLAQLLHDLHDSLPDDAIVTCDAGNFAPWLNRFFHFRRHQNFLGPVAGAMGYGVPAAIGAKILYPERIVVGCVGDGGFLMTGQEIATAFHHGVAPIILVFNNGMYGTIRMHQEREFPGRVSGTTLTNPDFVKFIESFGGYGELVKESSEFRPAFERAILSGKPALLELSLDPEQITPRSTIKELRAAGNRKAPPRANHAERMSPRQTSAKATRAKR